MSEMVERVARAIWEDRYPDMPWDGPDLDFMTSRETMRGHARAAIEAMREPTDKMIRHIQGCSITFDYEDVTYIEAEDARDAWRDAIDEALK